MRVILGAKMRGLRSGLVALFALSSLAAPAFAAAWWNDDWAFRKELTFDLSAAGANIAQSPADVPVLVRLSLANFSLVMTQHH
jgi:biopolymer transport protein ExbB